MQRSIAIAVLLTASVTPACADVVRLQGGRLVGEVSDPETEGDQSVTLTLPHGRVVLPERSVRRIDRESPAEAEHRRRAPTVSDTADAQQAFGLWCRANGLATEARDCFRRVIDLDPDHAEARRMLGYEWIAGVWMTKEDKLVARGLVRWQGEFVTPQEVELLRRQKAAKESSLSWRRRIDSIRTRLRSPDRETGIAAEEELDRLDDPAAAASLLAWLDSEPSPRVRRGLLNALGRIATPAALDRLLNAALTDPDPDMRAEALSIIGLINPPGMLDPFVQALGSNNNAVVNHAAMAIAELGGPALIGPLIDALITSHRRVISPGSDGQRYDINTASGRFGVGGGGPRVAKGELRNPDVLSALVSLSGENFLYDQPAWRAWLANQQTIGEIDLRRDP